MAKKFFFLLTEFFFSVFCVKEKKARIQKKKVPLMAQSEGEAEGAQEKKQENL